MAPNSTYPSPKTVAELHQVPLEHFDEIDLSEKTRPDSSSSLPFKDGVRHVDDDRWVCPPSLKSRTRNPIRAIVDPIVQNIKSGKERGDGKDHISLSLGDPTVGGNLSPCQDALDEVVLAAVRPSHSAGYINACGLPAARAAIAKYHSYEEHVISADNVIVASGCSGALEIALTSMLDPGTCLLVPKPGFPLYQVIAESHGARIVHYRLDPHNSWQCDMDHLEEIMTGPDSSTIRGILINNPSNPTGAVFCKAHLQDLVAFCKRYRLPIVADEVYGDLTFGRNQFHPMAQVAAQCGNDVPVITSSGLAKQFLLPGWRVGWLTFHDNTQGSLKEVELGAKQLAQVILGASHLTQAVVPKLLSPSRSIYSWKDTLRTTLEGQADYLYERLLQCHGLNAFSAPQGAMYLMVGIDRTKLDFVDDVEFCRKLLEEENVFVLPGIAFGYPNSFRIVFCCNVPILEAATQRIGSFCIRHSKIL